MSMQLSKAAYVSFATFRRSGMAVATAVWCAEYKGDYFIFSAGSAGKVKRLKNSNRARLATCDARGKLLGDWHEANAEVFTNPGDIEQALAALRNKYGFQMRLIDLGAKLTHRFDKRAYIRARLVEGPAQPSSARDAGSEPDPK